MTARLAMAQFPDVTLVLDTEGGTLSEVRGVGRLIAHWLAESADLDRTAARVAAHFGVDVARARTDVQTLWGQLTAEAVVLSRSIGVARSAEQPGSFDLSYRGTRVARIDSTGRELRWLGARDGSPCASWRLRLSLPHMLMARGYHVLHASAVHTGAGVLALTGASGAGKSTLGALLASRSVVSDDLVLVRVQECGAQVWLEAEARMRAFCESGAETFQREGWLSLGNADLERIASEPMAPLDAVWIVDAARRSGTNLQANLLAPHAATARLMLQSFAEPPDPTLWRRVLEVSHQLALRVPVSELEVPDTLTALKAAVADYRARLTRR